MEDKKILKVEKFDAVIAALEGQDENLIAFIQEEKERYINRQNKAKERNAKKRAENDELVDIVLNAVTNYGGPATRNDITEKVIDVYTGEKEITPAVVGARLTTLVKNGAIEKKNGTDEDGKRKMFYAPAGYFEAEAEEEE